eukprot:gene8913-6399_t
MKPLSLSSIFFVFFFWGCWLCGIHSRSLQSQVPPRGPAQYPAVGPYKGKIAFLFLARGDLPHEDLWELFFTFHAPPSFYSIYWHTQPDYQPAPHSFFRPYHMKHLIPTQWGTMSLVEASRNLIRQAIQDPENKYFALFSESCVPLLPFSVWYRGMMQHADRYSLVNACDFGADNMETPNRWRPELDTVPGFTPDKFRKSAQWVALNRKHATIVANDALLAPKFHVVQPADEHYVASLLALHHLDNETTCADGFTHVVWSDNRAAHPATYSPDSLAAFNPPPASLFAADKVVPLLSSSDGGGGGGGGDSLRSQRAELLGMWREYDKHRDVFAHLRNTVTTWDVFNGRCAFHALSAAEQTFLLPHGAQRATSWAVASDDVQRFAAAAAAAAGRHSGAAPEYLRHVDEDLLVNNTRAFAQFVVARGILPLSLFAPSARFQLLAMAPLLLRDEAFQLFLTAEEAFHRTVHRRLRFYRDASGDAKVFLLDHHQLLHVPDVRFLLFPVPAASITGHSDRPEAAAMAAYLSTVLPPLTAEEAARYGGVAQATSMFTLPEGTTAKYARDPTVYLVQNFTRRVIPDFETFLAWGLSQNEIRVVGPDELQQILGTSPQDLSCT